MFKVGDIVIRIDKDCPRHFMGIKFKVVFYDNTYIRCTSDKQINHYIPGYQFSWFKRRFKKINSNNRTAPNWL